MNLSIDDEEEEHEKDTLLSSYRRRWRGPVALTEDDFLMAFIEVDRANTMASVMARLQRGEWRTPTSFAKYFRKRAGWSQSFRYYLKRTKQITTYDDFFSLFPGRRPKP